MSERLTDDELLEMGEILIAFSPSRGISLLDRALAELRERRAADLSDEDRDALRVLAADMKRAEMRSPDIMYYPPHLLECRRILDRLLARSTP